jgi:hypothetical protein
MPSTLRGYPRRTVVLVLLNNGLAFLFLVGLSIYLYDEGGDILFKSLSGKWAKMSFD